MTVEALAFKLLLVPSYAIVGQFYVKCPESCATLSAAGPRVLPRPTWNHSPRRDVISMSVDEYFFITSFSSTSP